MMLALIIAVTFGPAALFSFLVLTDSRRKWPRTLETLSLTPALGFGFATLLDFFSRYYLNQSVGALEIGLAWGLFLVPALFWRWRKPRNGPDPETGSNSQALGLLAAFLVVMALVLANTLHRCMENSLRGQWDATAVWNLLGRTLARIDGDAGPILRNMDSTHSEYPHMVPGSISLLLRQMDDYAEGPGQFVAIMGLCSLFGLAFTGLRRLRGPMVAAISTGLLMAIPAYCLIAGDQYTEAWLAGLNVAAVTFVARGIQRKRALSVDLIFGGFLLGLLPWTKQEGIPLAMSLILAMLAFCLFMAPRLLHLRKLLSVLLGAAPGILASTLFRIFWARKDERLLSVSQGWEYLTDSERWLPVWSAFRDEVSTRGQVLGYNVPVDFNIPYQRWAAFWPALLVLGLIWSSRRGLMRRDTLFMALCLFAQLSAVSIIFVVVPIEQQFHIDTALCRCLIVVAPIALALVAALAGPTPEVDPVPAGREDRCEEKSTDPERLAPENSVEN